MKDEELLAEIESIIREMPEKGKLRSGDIAILEWLGRVRSAMKLYSISASAEAQLAIDALHRPRTSWAETNKIIILLFQAQRELRLRTVGPVNVAIGEGGTFEYFDELRKIIEQATSDILFIDPYIDAEFISKYLPHVKSGVKIRILLSKHKAEATSAALAFSEQNGTIIEIRSNKCLHDRYVIIDNSSCYQSGASFKDGAKKSSTTITQIHDIGPTVIKTYEDKWNNANNSDKEAA